MLNDLKIMGRLTTDAETTNASEKSKVTKFTVACDRDYVKEGEKRETDFFKVVAWNLPEKFIKKYLTKGELVVVSGRVQNRTWTDEDEKNHYVTEIISENIYPTSFNKEEIAG